MGRRHSGLLLCKTGEKAMKRAISAELKKTRREMMERRTKCHECNDYATELHHIIAVEDGGTDDIKNLMPLCNECHKEYTSEQTIERNKMYGLRVAGCGTLFRL